MNNQELNSLSQINEGKETLNELKENFNKVKSGFSDISDDEMNEVISKFTLEELDRIPLDKIEETLVNDKGVYIFDKEVVSPEMARDFCKYIITSEESFKNLDEEFAKVDDYLTEFHTEMDNLIKEYGSFNKAITSTLNKQISDDTLPTEVVERCKEMQDGIDNAKTLKVLIDLYDKIKPQNTVDELLNDYKRTEVIRAFKRLCKKYKIEESITRLGGLDKKILPEEEVKYDNLFIYTIVRYLKYQGDKIKSPFNLGFLTQITNYLKEIFLGEECEQYKVDLEEINELKKNISILNSKF